MTIEWRWAIVGAALALGCAEAGPVPAITGITPARAYSDRDVRVVIYGEGFLPSFEIDPGAGRRTGSLALFSGRVGSPEIGWVPLRDFGWRGTEEISATISPGLLPGVAEIQVTDPRGRSATLQQAFLAFGDDSAGPIVTIESPTSDAPLAPKMTMLLRARAVDAEPGAVADIQWTVRTPAGDIDTGSCSPNGRQPELVCERRIAIPSTLKQGDSVEIFVDGRDDAPVGNQTRKLILIVLRGAPGISGVIPARGGVAGGTEIVVRGTGFLPGSQAFVGGFPIVPNGGIVVDEFTITGRVPAAAGNLPALANLMVRTPIGDAIASEGFLYEAPPIVQAILPEFGDPQGGTEVRVIGAGFTATTSIYFGPHLATAVPLANGRLVSPSEIRGLSPGGQGRATIWAFDPALGWTRLVDGFGWLEMAP